MAENNQLSDETKNNSTDTSSTDASSAVIGNHENAVVPHKISNHDKLVQTMVMVDGEWINVNDTNDQANMKEDMHKVNKKVVEAQKGIVEAKNAADSAVKYADSAVSASKVNSDAIVAQSSAVIEVKSAMDSATAEIQQLKANAASDVAQIRVDVAQVQNEVDTAKAANSASVDKLKSDIGLAQKDLDNVHNSLTKAQSAVEQNQKLINDSVAKINNDIAQNRQDIVTAQQANDDLAKQLDAYSKEAQEQGKTIKAIQDNQDGFSITIADVKGDVTKVSDTVDTLSAGLKDAQGNITSVKAQADQLNATLTDHSKDIAQLTATAKELSSTLEDADGRLSKVEQTASEQSTTLSDLQGNLTQVKQTADNLVTTLKDAQGNLDQIKQDAKGTLEQLSNAQGDITALQKDVSGIKLTIADHDKNIHTLQADSKTLKDDMQNAQGDISTLKKTSTDVTTELKDHDGRISKTEQTASTLVNEFADQQGHLNRVEQKATGTEQTVANQQGQINTIKTDVSGIHETLTGQGNQIATINATLDGLNTKYEGVSGDLDKLKGQTQWENVTDTVDLNDIKTPCHKFLKGIVNNAPNEAAWWYLTVEGPDGSRVTQTAIADQSSNRYTRIWGGNEWSAWVKDATQTDVTALSNRITTNSTQIDQNKQAIALKADQATVNNLSGEVNQNTAQLSVQADQISSKVSSEDFNTLSNKVNGMKIGGRNLLHGTSDKPKSLQGSGWLAQSTASDIYTSTANYHGGNQFTYSALITNNSSKPVTLETWLFKGQEKGHDPINVNSHSQVVPPHAQNQRVSTTFAITAETHWIRTYVIYSTGDGISSEMVNVSEEQLEEGNVRTPWTPNPDDTIASIQKNTTAIDQTNKQISLKADQTEVDQVKQTATQNSSRLDVMANEISSKVTSTDVNNIVDKKGYATTSTVQSLITQKAGTINESITNLTSKVNSNGGGVNLLTGSKTMHDVWSADGTSIFNADDYLAVRAVGNNQRILQNPSEDTNGKLMSVSFDAEVPTDSKNQSVQIWVGPFQAGIGVTISGNAFKRYKVESWKWNSVNKAFSIQFRNANDKINIKNIKLEFGSVATPYSPAPSDNATVTQVQEITASIDGIQSTVANKADKSQITQLSNVIQSKVSTSDFTSKVSQLSNDINARVTKGDLLSQINVEAGRTLIQSNKIYFDADSFVMSPNSKAFIPSAYITNINADKITTGTLDAAKFNVKNFSADNITGGTLNGVVVKTGANDRYFQTSKDNIYWVRKGSMSLVGNDTYLNSANGLNIADEKNIQLTTWGGATVNKDGSITNNSGSYGHPRIVIDREGKYNPDAPGGETFGGGPGDSEIAQWVSNKEYTVLTRNQGFTVHLNDGNNKSIFAIQKDNKLGFYVGGGDNGNVINVTTAGTGNHIAVKTDGLDVDGEVNIKNNHGLTAKNVHVTGWLGVDGSKNSIVRTSQGTVAINAYETAEYYFGDIGEGQTGADGIAYIGIEKLFNETVNTTIPYHVFITAYGPGNIWVDQREYNRFVVKSDQPNLKFSWEIKAKRKGYEQTRLQNVDDKLNHMAATS